MMIRTFIYKRTHEGDPSADGRFGCCDCMGKLRNLPYGAVIGIGGIGPEAKKNGIAGTVTWIGIGPTRESVPWLHGELVTFETFCYFGKRGRDFRVESPVLSTRLYSRQAPRFIFDDFNPREQAEIESLLALVENSDRSRHRAVSAKRRPKSCRCTS
jgi:hypothetical protein